MQCFNIHNIMNSNSSIPPQYDDLSPPSSYNPQFPPSAPNPVLQPLPRTYVGFYREWRRINPSNTGPIAFLREKMRSGEELKRARALAYAYDSHAINRCAHHTMIILLGIIYYKKIIFDAHLLLLTCTTVL